MQTSTDKPRQTWTRRDSERPADMSELLSSLRDVDIPTEAIVEQVQSERW